MNQHRSDADRNGMIDGLDQRGEADSTELAAIMRRIEAERVVG
jgi:hypothetical protein